MRANTQGMSMKSKNSFYLPETSIQELCHAAYQIWGKMETECVKILDASIQVLASLAAGTEYLI